MMIAPRPGQTERQMLDENAAKGRAYLGQQTAANGTTFYPKPPTAPGTPSTPANPFQSLLGALPGLQAPPGQPPTATPTASTPAAPPGPTSAEVGQAMMDPAPYNQAVTAGKGLLGGIPTSAGAFASLSPALRGMNPHALSRLNGQMAGFGNNLQNQAGLEFSRKAGTEVPRMLLGQLSGLRTLENDTANVGNTLLTNQVQGGLSQTTALLRLLGALGGFF